MTTHLARLMILFLAARDFGDAPNWRMSGRRVVDALRKMVPGLVIDWKGVGGMYWRLSEAIRGTWLVACVCVCVGGLALH